MKNILVQKAIVTINIVIVCEKCGRQGITAPIILDIKCTTVESLPDAVANHPDARIGTRFPVGWAGYGDYYHCPDCIN